MENNTIVLRKPYPTRKKKRGNISQKRGSKAFNGTFLNQFWQHLQKKPFLLVDYGSFTFKVKFKQTKYARISQRKWNQIHAFTQIYSIKYFPFSSTSTCHFIHIIFGWQKRNERREQGRHEMN